MRATTLAASSPVPSSPISPLRRPIRLGKPGRHARRPCAEAPPARSPAALQLVWGLRWLGVVAVSQASVPSSSHLPSTIVPSPTMTTSRAS
jgi:hypothetical protein